ncbi:hypothetical protein [Sphingobacterium sp. MYb382]|uniref:hypothetical protein n=1 Tax=Sphingobacterium sp. MYb382 TaxID=2745278 RepID=UPI003096B484
MKAFTVYILALCLLSQSFGAAWVLASFYKNRNYLAKNLCILRYEKVNTCKGECILVKQLRTLKETDTEKTSLKINEYSFLSLPQENLHLALHWMAESDILLFPTPAKQQACCDGFTTTLFQPPIA